MTLALKVDRVTVDYGPVRALNDVSVELKQGTVCGLIGHNGSGKSTLMKAILGLVEPVSGKIELHGTSVNAARQRAAVGYVPQSEAIDLDFPVTVSEVVMMGRYGHLGILRVPKSRDRKSVEEALDRVGLSDLAGRSIGALSGGQRKRVFVARCIAQEAEVLLLDEPFAGVDAGSERDIAAVLRGLASEGRTLMVSTHHLDGVAELCDEVLLLAGKVVAQGPPEDTMTTKNLAQLLGGIK